MVLLAVELCVVDNGTTMTSSPFVSCVALHLGLVFGGGHGDSVVIVVYGLWIHVISLDVSLVRPSFLDLYPVCHFHWI